MPVRHRDLGDEIAPPEPKRCRHCDESSCGGGGGSSGSEWRVTLDHDLVETLSAIYPEWFKPQHRRDPAPAAPPTPPDEDTFSSSSEEMAGRAASGSEGASSPRPSPPKVVVDESPLQPAMGKHKESLKVKLMMRRPINQLVAQGIMPPLKTPPAYFEQCKQLERAKTGDLLKAKIQRRPDRQELERRHILVQENHVDPSLAEKQRMLKKARLADQLNDQLSHRPGPLELIKKNILHTEETIETAVKSGVLAFKATSEGASGRPQHPSSYCGPPDEVSPSPSPPSTLSPASVSSPPQHPAPGKDKNRKKSKHKQHQPKARFKFHEYKVTDTCMVKENIVRKPASLRTQEGLMNRDFLNSHWLSVGIEFSPQAGPPSAQKVSPATGDVETPYELLLQQQQLLLQLMVPSPGSAHSPASDVTDHPPPCTTPAPPAGLPTALHPDMKVSDLRAECKRRNLRVSGTKHQLLDRLRPFMTDINIKQEEPPRSPASVASVASPEPRVEETKDSIVQSQRRQIEELERKLEASRQQLESVRREAAGAAASDQSRRLLQAHICVSQLRAQLDALQQPPQPPPPPRYVIDTAPERLVRLFTVTPPATDATTTGEVTKTNQAYILNGVKVVPIAILPTHYEPEQAPPPPPPPPPPLPLHRVEDNSQIMDDVLEILVENGELPPSAVVEPSNPSIESYLQETDSFSPADVLGDAQIRDCLAADELQRELDDIQNEIMNHADLQAASDNIRDMESVAPGIDADLNVDLLTATDFQHCNGNAFQNCNGTETPADHDDFFRSLLSGDHTVRPHIAMDVADDQPERMSMTPLTNGDILDHGRPGFEDIEDLSLPSFQDDDTRNGNFAPFEERPGDFDLKELMSESNINMNVDGEHYDYMETETIPNHFGRGHVPPCDPLLGGVLARPAPRPHPKHYSWDRIEFDHT